MTQGYLVSVDGLDGSGKSTQAKLLAAELGRSGWPVQLTREPGGTPSAELIRNLLVNGDPARFCDMTEVLLFAAARREHIRDLILPCLERGIIAVSDRGLGSSLAYQTATGQVSRQQVLAIHNTSTGGLRPDVTILIDIPADVALARARSRIAESGSTEDRFEKKGLSYLERVRDGFLQCIKSEPNWFRVDGMQSVEAVHEQIVQIVHDRLALTRNPRPVAEPVTA